jgi:hypothetical protein
MARRELFQPVVTNTRKSEWSPFIECHPAIIRIFDREAAYAPVVHDAVDTVVNPLGRNGIVDIRSSDEGHGRMSDIVSSSCQVEGLSSIQRVNPAETRCAAGG